MTRILAWDLETSALSADYGLILCCGFKEVGHGKPKVISIDDYKGKDIIEKERKLLIDLSKVLLDCDCWLTWFGTYFDVPFVNSRLIYHGLPVVPPTFTHIDGWKVSRNRLKLRNNRLKTVQEFLGTETEKDAVLGPTWIRALAGDKKALQYVISHCWKDVQALDEVYFKLRPLIIDHPNGKLLSGAKGGCGVCGDKRLQARGYRMTRTRKFQRYQCQGCGSWGSDPKPVMVVSA